MDSDLDDRGVEEKLMVNIVRKRGRAR